MHNRVLMAKFDPAWALEDVPACDCGLLFEPRDTVLLYPIPEAPDYREAVCITCHFWFVHEVMSEIGL